MVKIIECVPNFSEGKDKQIIEQITAEIRKIKGVQLLDVDPGYDTNRTVVTFVGYPEAVKEAAFNAIKKSHELIDMSKHHGAHPRFGACDVCPIIPVSDVTMDECAEIAKDLAKKLGSELEYPVYLYEHAAQSPERKNLANVRAGEYEGLPARLKDPHWKPDFGPADFKATKGATAVGAREFLIAYNVNLNTTDAKLANELAQIIREQGYPKKDADGKLMKDSAGNKIMMPGKFRNCKAIGWYVDDYKRAQISINLTDYNVTSMHHVFDELTLLAQEKGLRVTGSEVVGVVPKKAMLEAGIHYLEKQEKCGGQSEEELIKIAIQSLGLNDAAPFKPNEKIIEYMICGEKSLSAITVSQFNDLLASDAPAPGGGSVAALCGSLAASLGSMVANLTHGKKGYTKHNELMNNIAKEMQIKKAELLSLIDDDTAAFNIMMSAMSANKKAAKSENSDEIKKAKEKEYEAMKNATSIPLAVMEKIISLTANLKKTAECGNVNAVSDAGVGALLVESGVKSAALNVKINLNGFDKNDEFRNKTTARMHEILSMVDPLVNEILDIVESKLSTK